MWKDLFELSSEKMPENVLLANSCEQPERSPRCSLTVETTLQSHSFWLLITKLRYFFLYALIFFFFSMHHRFEQSWSLPSCICSWGRDSSEAGGHSRGLGVSKWLKGGLVQELPNCCWTPQSSWKKTSACIELCKASLYVAFIVSKNLKWVNPGTKLGCWLICSLI